MVGISGKTFNLDAVWYNCYIVPQRPCQCLCIQHKIYYLFTFYLSYRIEGYVFFYSRRYFRSVASSLPFSKRFIFFSFENNWNFFFGKKIPSKWLMNGCYNNLTHSLSYDTYFVVDAKENKYSDGFVSFSCRLMH